MEPRGLRPMVPTRGASLAAPAGGGTDDPLSDKHSGHELGCSEAGIDAGHDRSDE